MGLEFARPWDAVADLSRGPEWAQWFVGGKLNIAWNCVHRWADRRPEGIAAVSLGEDGARRELTWAAMSREVVRLAEALAGLGVREGDRVAIFLPMSQEVADRVARLRAHRCDPGADLLRLRRAGGRAAAAGLGGQGGDHDRDVAATWPRGADAGDPGRGPPRVTCSGARDRLAPWDEVVADSPGELPAAELDSETPYLLTYTSGTTGRPKGVVHVQGGFLVSISREVCYQADAKPDDVIHFSTDMGWIMGPWTVVGGGAMGSTLVFAEGAPDWPTDRLWRLIEQERVSILGLSPTLVRALIPHGDPTADLTSLRVMVTTGEPWNPDPYRWLFEQVGGGRVPIINCSGGTEIGACFLSPVPSIPIKECSLGGPALGMAMDVVDADGNSVVASGEVGELVCRKPFPAMTRGFWRDPERYLDTYWRRFPGIWTHGDWASVDEDGYWFLHGRSDDTLNIAGKRIGPAELESAAVAHPSVLEAAAVGIPHDVKGEVAWLFCIPAPGVETDDELSGEVCELVAGELGKAFRPDRVVFVNALPKTRSAKIMRRAVRAKALGADPGDLSSLENPEALDEIARLVG